MGYKVGHADVGDGPLTQVKLEKQENSMEETRTTQIDRLDEDLSGVEAFAGALNIDVLSVNELTFEQAAAQLKRVRAAVKLLQDSEQAFEDWLDEVWQHKRSEARQAGEQFGNPIEVPGVATVEVKRGSERKTWDHAGLSKAVLESLLTDLQGEMASPWQVRDAIMDAVGVSYWRVKELKRRGIDVDDFCVKSPGKRSVILT